MVITTKDPFTQKLLCEYDEEDIEDVRTKVVSLKEAQRVWSKELDRRLEALKGVRSRLQSNLKDLSILMIAKWGRSSPKAKLK